MKQNLLRKKFFTFVSLNILGMLGLSLYILADTYFVAKGLGTYGIASLNLAIAIYSFIHATGLMIGMGGASKYAILSIQKNPNANSYFMHSVFLGIALGLLFFLVGVFASEPLSMLLGANENTFEMTSTYLKTILCFAPFFILNNILIAFIRNDGEPKLAMCGMLIGSFSNIILDYVFIFPLGMGMFGAAFATGLAPIISLLILSLHFIKKNNHFYFHRFQLKLKAILHIFTLGISSFITEFSSGIVLIIFNIVILAIAGDVGVAAYGIIANLSLVGIAIFVGIGQGMQPLVSHSYAQSKQSELRLLLRYAILLSLLIAIFIYGAIYIYHESIIAMFNSDQNAMLKDYASTGLLIYFIGFLFASINIILISFLNSSQNPKVAFLISILRGFVLILPCIYILSNTFGILGVWLVFPIVEAITFLISLCLLLRHKQARIDPIGKE